MSVEYYIESGEQRSTEFKAAGGEETTRRHFVFKMTSATDDSNDIRASGYLPAPGSQHPKNSRATAESYSFNPKGNSPMLWDVVVEYTTAEVSGGSSQLPQAKEFTPTLRAAEVTWSYVQFRKPLVKALELIGGQPFSDTEQPIVNSAGVPYNPPPEVDDSRLQCSISKNLSSVPSWILSYQDAVNSDPVRLDGLNFPPGTLKMTGVQIGPLQFENYEFFRNVQAVIQYQEKGWDIELLDAGFATVVDVVGGGNGGGGGGGNVVKKLVRAVDEEGVPVTEPILLNGFGKRLPQGEDPKYMAYRQKGQRKPFAVLPLG